MWPYACWLQGHGRGVALAHPHPEAGCVNPQAQECHHWPNRGLVLQPAAGPPMLIGGSEALGGMQISPALLRYPSVPLPVLSNPLIPPDWRRGGRGGEQLLVSCLLPVGTGCVEARGEGGGYRTAAAVALIRGWASRPMSYTVHQRRSASQPESQMTPSTCTALLNPPLPSVPHPFIPHLPHYLLLPFRLTLQPPLLLYTLSPLPPSLLVSSHLSVTHPPTLTNPTLPWDRSVKATCRMLVVIKRGWERERCEKRFTLLWWGLSG